MYSTKYESFIMLLAALLNGVAGIVVDLYAPCLPAIAKEMQISIVSVQNTISIPIIGYACGQIIFGILCDWKGRKATIVGGLCLFTGASLMATFSHNIETLMAARILQGFAAGSCQVVGRASLIDVVKGQRFTIGVVYLSVAFALGLIVGPYIGAIIQQLWGWRWNFVVYALYSFVLLCMVIFWMKESLKNEYIKLPNSVFLNYKRILSNSIFIVSFIQLGCCFIALTVWNQIGPFVVEHAMGKSSTYFGTIALLAGIGYLVGTLLNRFLIRYLKITQRITLSSCVFLAGVLSLMLGGDKFEEIYLLFGLILIMLAQGLAFSNVLSSAMALFPDMAGVTASLQGAGMLIMGAIGLSIVSIISVDTSMIMGLLYGVSLLIFTIARLIGSQIKVS